MHLYVPNFYCPIKCICTYLGDSLIRVDCKYSDKGIREIPSAFQSALLSFEKFKRELLILLYRVDSFLK